MKKFKKQNRYNKRTISTASLPDIVFMLLFFFMATAVMKQDNLLVRIIKPEASEIKRIENKSLVNYIHVGKPFDERKYGVTSRIQVNDAFIQTESIKEYIASSREPLTEPEQQKMIISMQVDCNTEMGIVTDIKQELRKAGVLKINYSVRDDSNLTN